MEETREESSSLTSLTITDLAYTSCVCSERSLHVYQSAAAGVNMAAMIPLLCSQLHPKPQSKRSVNHKPVLIRTELC